jgi:N-acetylmuramoyl-L-alanine amidase
VILMKINNGIVASDDIKIIQHLIPISNKLARPRYPMKAEYITIHNTGNPGASALANSKYVDSVNNYVSWHFTIGKDEVYQELPITESAWHAGDGANGAGNRKSIGIEIAEVPGAEETAIKFVALLLNATGLNIDKVVPHQRWSGKYCPRLILPHWDKFIDNIRKEMSGNTNRDKVQKRFGFDNNTMSYLDKHPYPDALYNKLANMK